ncbi:MAG: DUF1963 domain-containing protein [Candidatus Obscuribacterales bacterium]
MDLLSSLVPDGSILASIPEGARRGILARLLKAGKPGNFLIPLEEGEDPDSPVRLGGSPGVALPEPWPCGRQGEPLSLLVEVNLEALPVPSPRGPAAGRLLVFASPDLSGIRKKDRDWFRVMHSGEAPDPSTSSSGRRPRVRRGVVLPASIEESTCGAILARLQTDRPEESAVDRAAILKGEFEALLKAFQERSQGQGQIFGDFGRAGQKACVVAAFHANGVSYSPERQEDRHYRHLVDSAADWFAIMRIREKPKWGVTDGEIWLCARHEDWREGVYHRSRLLA